MARRAIGQSFTIPSQQQDREEHVMICYKCGDAYPSGRNDLGYSTCLGCGEDEAVEARASWTIVPLPKQGYTRITNPEELLDLNQKKPQ